MFMDFPANQLCALRVMALWHPLLPSHLSTQHVWSQQDQHRTQKLWAFFFPWNIVIVFDVFLKWIKSECNFWWFSKHPGKIFWQLMLEITNDFTSGNITCDLTISLFTLVTSRVSFIHFRLALRNYWSLDIVVATWRGRTPGIIQGPKWIPGDPLEPPVNIQKIYGKWPIDRSFTNYR